MSVPLIDLQAQVETIRAEIDEAIREVVSSQRFIRDEQVGVLEEEIAARGQRGFAIGCASGTDALLLSLMAIGVGSGDEVITSSYSSFASASMISWRDAIPVFVDIEPA